MNKFSEISFGFSSAEAERTNEPGLLIDGYIDFASAGEEALHGRKFLFLGYKGAGKSSIAERIQLTRGDKFSYFVKLISLADFPFTPFSKIIRGDAEPETKYPTAWSWIILVYLLESFASDEGAFHPDSPIFQDAVKAFRQMGLSPAADPGAIVRASAKNSFKLSLPGKLAEWSSSGSDLRPASEIPDFVQSLKELLTGMRSGSKHYLIIDGLDDVLTSREVQYKSLSALIFEANRLNLEFSRHNVPAKIILLCRTDLFEKIPGSNKNKIRQDHSVELDWYHDPSEPDKCLLLKVAQLRTERSLGNKIDLFKKFFPEKIDGTIIQKYLLEMTRHTPRDFLRLLFHIQKFAAEGVLTLTAIKSGLREYSIKYFLPEIQDELNGYATPDEISQILSSLGRLRRRDFSLNDLIEISKNSAKPLHNEKILEIIEALFQCSALGNIQQRTKGSSFYTFRYRNRHSSFNETENIMLHRGLWKALNLI